MTHGEMRSRDSLLEGLASALTWTIKYYWTSEEKSRLLSNEGTDGTLKVLKLRISL